MPEPAQETELIIQRKDIQMVVDVNKETDLLIEIVETDAT